MCYSVYFFLHLSLLWQLSSSCQFPLINSHTLNTATTTLKSHYGVSSQTKQGGMLNTWIKPDMIAMTSMCMIKWIAGSAGYFSPLRQKCSPVCSTHGRAGAVNTQHLAVKTGLRLSVSPWHLFTQSTPRPRPIPARLYQRESQQNGGTDNSHVTSLCFRVRFQVKRMHTTRLTNKISNLYPLIITLVLELGRKM